MCLKLTVKTLAKRSLELGTTFYNSFLSVPVFDEIFSGN